MLRRFVEPGYRIACREADDALVRIGLPIGRHLQPEDTVRGSKQPFMADRFSHRLIVDDGIFAGGQKLHWDLKSEKNADAAEPVSMGSKRPRFGSSIPLHYIESLKKT